MIEVVVVGRIAGCHHEGVLGPHAGRDRESDAIVDVSGVEQGVWLSVVGAERYAVGPVT